MNLYILNKRNDLEGADNPWVTIYDKYDSFLVSAENETNARIIAASYAADEGSSAWADSKYSTCEILVPIQKECLIMSSFNAG